MPAARHAKLMACLHPMRLTEMTLGLPVALVVVLALAGCGSVRDYEPTVDLKGREETQYRADLHDCQEIAARADTGGGGEVAKGAGVGTVLGGAGGAAAGAIGGDAATGAAAGALSGLVFGGAHQALDNQSAGKRIVRNCLSHRGYPVLD
jgi:outer membrane lipoprotein SlyB